MRPLAPRAERPAGGGHHLIGAHQALACRRPGAAPRAAGSSAARRSRNAAPPSRRWSACACARTGSRDRRHGGQAVDQRLEIEPGAADQQRPAGRPRARPRSRRPRQLAPAADRAALGRIDHAVEPMRRPRSAPRVRARRQHLQVAIDLHAVGIDDGRRRNSSASARASADLPLAVGPAMITTAGFGAGAGAWSASRRLSPVGRGA